MQNGFEPHIGHFVKYRRKKAGLLQDELAKKAGVGLRFLRELEQGKNSLRLDKVNQVLELFGFTIGTPVPLNTLDPYLLLAQYFNQGVIIQLKTRITLVGTLVEPIDYGMGIWGWRFLSNKNTREFRKTKSKDLLEEIRHIDIQEIELNQL
jgi:y4mF family transcriptional regulator